MDDVPFINTVVDLKARFDEIVGVTYLENVEPEEIVFAVQGKMVNYIRTKPLHITQMELNEDWAEGYCSNHPFLSGWTFFSIECRPNPELLARFASYGQNLVVVSPNSVLSQMSKMLFAAADNYGMLATINCN